MITWLTRLARALAFVAWQLLMIALLLLQTAVLLAAVGAKNIIAAIARHRGRGGM